MIEFKDRIANNINRRHLVVQGIIKDANGDIKELEVDILRSNEESPTVEGTPLKATELNAMFSSVNASLEFLLKPYFSTTDNLTANWTQEIGVPKSASFRITLTGPNKFYGKVTFDNDFLDGGAMNYDDENLLYIDIEIIEKENLNTTSGSSTKSFNFYVELYFDAIMTNFATKLKGTVNYSYPPTAPID